MISTSPRFQINGTDIFKTLRGSAVVFASVFVVGGFEAVSAALQSGQFDLGSFDIATPLLIALMSNILELTRRYFKSYE